MKYYIIAGEASGDMHAANLMKQLKQRDTDAFFRVWGGDKMQAETNEMVRHFKDSSFMGIFNVLWNIRTIKKNFTLCENDIMTFKPDVLILIDNSGFNLRIAKYVRLSKLPTRIYYYILPQAWAWKQKRVHTIHQWCHRVFAILPFEKEFYKSYGYDVDYVGHPILDVMEQRKPSLLGSDELRKEFNLSEKPIIALLPGSRKQEIKTKLPAMLKVVKHFPDYQFVIAGSETIDLSFYKTYLDTDVKIIFSRTYDILNNATAALVTSGTATLETALFRVPQVVCYKPGYVTYHLLSGIVKIKYICMVNLILDRMAVQELIESDLNEKRMVKELNLILEGDRRVQILKDYDELEVKMGGPGASSRTAELMWEDISR
ncbi:lipid-A-disaccharide synthase [Roseivirga ehrenbergii]|uniref:Lipid-A-disaccharide synthase n=1 Tax=Roseivirga ehrenbergii (strain DSM 102268 / JCM 13514 / KCTC 12282 / NCIMB 14502 / KMM 6017) TaxID=279360 RepID=A0A150X793_ROSEK|nr:lipid-A-disaccharide synthase [Roseivirga ehrenbergii]KYG74560.1 lipid-A-disaccharide synthase [Roseivirga ehrenbergii]TCL14125.1 lipid-A-disaccharide synthase [Roseivirga ehrenbergii]